MSEEIVLSASKIDTFQSCSWLYWTKYHLKVPDPPNIGAMKGTVCHALFENLVSSNKTELIEKIKNDGTCKYTPHVWRYLHIIGKKEGLFDESHFDHVDEMVVNALREGDFLPDIDKYDLEVEKEFKLKICDGVSILGYIDLLIQDKKTGQIIIRDYKSSKEKFAPKKINNNLQGMVYAYSVWKETGIIPTVVFWFLQYPKEIRQVMPPVSEDEMHGFGYFLQFIGEQMKNFNFEKAKLNYAKDMPKPERDEGFSGCLKCGFAKHKDQLKKDGTKMWHCNYKFDLSYYVITDSNGDIKHKSLYRKDLMKYTDNPKDIELRYYNGCPAFK